MKKVLFIMNNLHCGGAEKALISLLETLDYSRFSVDLFLFKHEGVFLKNIPSEVNILPEPKMYRYFDMPFKQAISSLVSKGKLGAVYARTMLGYLAKTEKNGAVVEQKLWKYLSRMLEKQAVEYDVAIAFQEKTPIYFCVDHVRAKKKIGWIHTDYTKLGIDFQMEAQYFQKLDHIATVSEELVAMLQGLFPVQREKFTCIHNIVSPYTIQKLAEEKTEVMYKSGTSLVSVGRLVPEKGLDLSLEAFALLVRRGYDLHWYLIGEGNMRNWIENEIELQGLQSRVHLLGLKENPYPYIKAADLYIQTSRYEGRSISIEEAKILTKPIVITNFPTAHNHLQDGINGAIANMDAKAVADKIALLLDNKEMAQSFTTHLSTEELGTEHEVEKLYRLLHEK